MFVHQHVGVMTTQQSLVSTAHTRDAKQIKSLAVGRDETHSKVLNSSFLTAHLSLSHLGSDYVCVASLFYVMLVHVARFGNLKV